MELIISSGVLTLTLLIAAFLEFLIRCVAPNNTVHLDVFASGPEWADCATFRVFHEQYNDAA
jgi:hypothetical protein